MHSWVRQMYCRVAPFMRNAREYNESDVQLRKIHNKYKGERLFIIGMGPSLDKTRFDLIKNEHIMATNNLFQGFKKFKVEPRFWCVADEYPITEFHKELLDLETILFLTEDAGIRYIKNGYRGKYKPVLVRKLGDIKTWECISTNLIRGAYGGMVIYACLQVAYWLGFKEVYLLGCDCTFDKGVHFEGAEHEKGLVDEWQSSFKMYEIFKKTFEEDGRKVYNSTVGGNLEVFERRSLEEIK